MKITINDIYDDNLTIFAGNTLIENDARLSEIFAMSDDLDLICEMSFGARELLRHNIKNDNEHGYIYDMTKINRHVYAIMIENILKYMTLLTTQESLVETGGEISYRDTYVRGENEQTREYGSRQDTTTYGDVNTTHNVGATSQTTQNGARENTNSVSAFSTNTFNPTDKTNGAQSTDVVNFAAQSNSEQTTHGNDTRTQGSHLDKITNDETTDTKTGVRDLIDNVSKYRRFFDKSVLLTIVTDCVNAITYSMYL